MRSIHVRLPEVADRQFPGRLKGDLIQGEANASPVGALVERVSRLLIRIKFARPNPAFAANVLQAFTDKLRRVAQPMRLSMTCDQGREMGVRLPMKSTTGPEKA
jgi:IS30 family transposase